MISVALSLGAVLWLSNITRGGSIRYLICDKKKVILIFCLISSLSLKNGQTFPQSSFLWFPQKILLFPKKLFNMKIFTICFLIKKVIFIFSARWPLLKNGHIPKIFSPFSPKMLLFSKKLLDENIFRTSFPIKKVIFIFVAERPLRFKRDLGSGNSFLSFSQKIQLFLKKLLNNKIFSTSFVIKKGHINFGDKTLPFPKQSSNVSQNCFSLFSRKILFFSKNLFKEIIFSN